MKERPMLFSAPMVRAILEGLKTQTRRVVKDSDVTSSAVRERGRILVRRDVTKTCLYGEPCDRLWVKETWGTYRSVDNLTPTELGEIERAEVKLWYRADGCAGQNRGQLGRWRSPRFMPRWASRITLEITAVRLERLQEISEEDAIAEGVELAYGDVPAAMGNCRAWRDYSGRSPWHSSAWASYRSLWESLNGRGSWEENPWVWVISFPRCAP